MLALATPYSLSMSLRNRLACCRCRGQNPFTSLACHYNGTSLVRSLLKRSYLRCSVKHDSSNRNWVHPQASPNRRVLLRSLWPLSRKWIRTRSRKPSGYRRLVQSSPNSTSKQLCRDDLPAGACNVEQPPCLERQTALQPKPETNFNPT